MAQTPAGSRPASQNSEDRTSARSTGPDWTPVSRGGRRRVVAAIVALAMLLTAVGGTVVGILAASPASAHDQLLSSDPADGDELDEPVDTLTLTYSAAIIPDGTQVRVVTPEGEVDAEASIEGDVVTATFDAPAVGGDYEVQWRVVSSDGHPIEGDFTYTVAEQEPVDAAEAEAELEESGELEGLGATETETEAEPEPEPTESEPAAPADDESGAMPLVFGAALIGLIGVAGVLVARSRRRLHETSGQAPNADPQD